MKQDVLEDFAEQLGAPTERVLEEWQGRPDRIIDDIFRVRDIDTGEVRDLELFGVQRKVVHAYFYGDASTLNLYKGRRIGYSFIMCACFLLEGIFYPHSFYPIVSRSLGQSKNRISDIENLIRHAKVDIPTNKTNTDYIELWNESAFHAYSADSDVSRGDRSGRAVLMDEMAFMEDEEKAQRAFGAFLALGENRKMCEVSTPNTKNDDFMQHFRRGSPEGKNGIIAIQQPTFRNADEIDIHTSLYDQDVEPVRPDLNIHTVENERLRDPEGFGQEYLCRPVVDEYRFFSEEKIRLAMDKSHEDGYMTGMGVPHPNGVRRIMGIDIAAGVEGGDDTVMSVMDHSHDDRLQRYLGVVDEDLLREAGIGNPDTNDVLQVSELIAHVYRKIGADAVILDKGGVGQTFERQIERQLGREVVGFDFSAADKVNEMFEDMNACHRQGNLVLLDDDRLFDEMASIVKQKKEDHSTPRYSGKDNSESGKDDTAMATVLSAFPPYISQSPATRPAEKPREVPDTKLTKKDDVEHPEQVAYGSGRVSVRSRRSRSSRRPSRYARQR